MQDVGFRDSNVRQSGCARHRRNDHMATQISTIAHGVRYVHGVRADDDHWTDAWNFSLAGTRSSVGLMNAVESNPTPYDVDLSVLAGSPDEWPPMFLSGFMVTLRMGAIARAGGRLGRGVAPYTTKWATHESQERVKRNADRELALEAGRRHYAPSAPSRLCCLWLAEDTVPGRAWVQEIVGPQSFLMQIQITRALMLCRCDARWLDQVHTEPSDEEAVAGYWSGQPSGAEPLWEHLLEGQIEAEDAAELQRLREFIRIQGPPADLRASPSAQQYADS
jgi:hypothetical protein